MATLNVGSGGQFTRISDAIAASQNGDTIDVQAGTYTNDFATVTKNITIQGTGGTANLVATQSPSNGKAILTTDADVTVNNLSFSGASVPDGNGAGIRYETGNLTINNSSFHDNQDGLLAAANPSGSITINGSEFANNGTGDGYTHNIYVNEIGTLTVENSYIHDANVGHEIKSRADNTIIENNQIKDNGSTASYSIDMPDGGHGVVTGNTIEKGPNSQSPVVVHFGGEGGPYPGSSLQIDNNTVTNDLGSGSARLLYNSTDVTADVSGNQLFGLTPDQISVGPVSINGNSFPGTQSGSDHSATGAGAPTTPDNGATGAGAPTTPVASTPDTTPAPSTQPDPSPAPPAATQPDPTTAPVPAQADPAAVSAAAQSGDTLVLNLAEDAWNGDAQFVVSVDGQQIGNPQTVTTPHAANAPQEFDFGGNFGAGPHDVAVSFINDAWGGTPQADRNLYVDGVSLNGQAPASFQPVNMWSDGTAVFHLDGNGAGQHA